MLPVVNGKDSNPDVEINDLIKKTFIKSSSSIIYVNRNKNKYIAASHNSCNVNLRTMSMTAAGDLSQDTLIQSQWPTKYQP